MDNQSATAKIGDMELAETELDEYLQGCVASGWLRPAEAAKLRRLLRQSAECPAE